MAGVLIPTLSLILIYFHQVLLEPFLPRVLPIKTSAPRVPFGFWTQQLLLAFGHSSTYLLVGHSSSYWLLGQQQYRLDPPIGEQYPFGLWTQLLFDQDGLGTAVSPPIILPNRDWIILFLKLL